MRFPLKTAVLVAILLVAGCTTMPSGPSMMVLPGANKSFDQFRADDIECRNYALASIGGVTPGQAASESGVGSAVVGTLLGAAAGAAIDGHEGAAVGAGTGLLIGGLAGTGTAQVSGYQQQHYYDLSYIQCMYAKGHQVPVSGRAYQPYWQERYQRYPPYGPPSAPQGIPPPPAGMPPPPPPGVTAP